MITEILLSSFRSTPRVTKSLTTLYILIVVLVYTDICSPFTLMYIPSFEIWRLVTSFLYFGTPTLEVIIHVSFLYRYSKMLEEGFTYTSDYLYLVIVVWFSILILGNIFNISLMSTAFSSTITYIWTRKNPHTLVALLGFISFPAFYLPFIVPVYTLLMNKKVLKEDFIGIFIGHMYYFLKDVYPKWGSDILRTPYFLKWVCGEKDEGNSTITSNKAGEYVERIEYSNKEKDTIKEDGTFNKLITKDHNLIKEEYTTNDSLNNNTDTDDGWDDEDWSSEIKE